MSTTIAIKDGTMEMLRMMKEETESETFDETINKIIIKSKNVDTSLFWGKYKGMPEFKRDKKDRLYKV